MLVLSLETLFLPRIAIYIRTLLQYSLQSSSIENYESIYQYSVITNRTYSTLDSVIMLSYNVSDKLFYCIFHTFHFVMVAAVRTHRNIPLLPLWSDVCLKQANSHKSSRERGMKTRAIKPLWQIDKKR